MFPSGGLGAEASHDKPELPRGAPRESQLRAGNSSSSSSNAAAPSFGMRDQTVPSPLSGGRSGLTEGKDHSGPPSIPSRMGDRGAFACRSRPGSGFHGPGTANGAARGRGDPRGGGSQGYGYGGDFRNSGRSPGRWNGAGRGREWDRERELDWEHRSKWDRERDREGDPDRDKAPERDRGMREWERGRGRPGGSDRGGSENFSPLMSASDPYSSVNRVSRRPLGVQDRHTRVCPSPTPPSPVAAAAAAAVPKAALSEEERQKQAEVVAEEARAFAERERRIAERGDEVWWLMKIAKRLLSLSRQSGSRQDEDSRI